jgi:DNA-nicking Smr family endonuclease
MANRKHESDDVEAFRAAVRDVKPLKQPRAAAHSVPRSAARNAPGKRLRRPAAADAAQDLNATMPLIATPLDGGDVVNSSVAFKRNGVRDQVMRKLRRGLYPVDAELDLHGHTQAAARVRLAQFLAASLAEGLRCVRIIHGKGYRSGGRGPVLKIAVDLWLRRHFDVMAFTSAKAIDGGSGALYVLLRV